MWNSARFMFRLPRRDILVRSICLRLLQSGEVAGVGHILAVVGEAADIAGHGQDHA